MTTRHRLQDHNGLSLTLQETPSDANPAVGASCVRLAVGGSLRFRPPPYPPFRRRPPPSCGLSASGPLSLLPPAAPGAAGVPAAPSRDVHELPPKWLPRKKPGCPLKPPPLPVAMQGMSAPFHGRQGRLRRRRGPTWHVPCPGPSTSRPSAAPSGGRSTARFRPSKAGNQRPLTVRSEKRPDAQAIRLALRPLVPRGARQPEYRLTPECSADGLGPSPCRGPKARDVPGRPPRTAGHRAPPPGAAEYRRGGPAIRAGPLSCRGRTATNSPPRPRWGSGSRRLPLSTM